MNLNENKYFAVKNRKNHDVHLEKRTSFFQLLWRPIIFKILKHWYFLIRKQATVASLKIFDKNLSNLNPNKKSFEKRHLLKNLCQNYIRKVLLTSSHEKNKNRNNSNAICKPLGRSQLFAREGHLKRQVKINRAENYNFIK